MLRFTLLFVFLTCGIIKAQTVSELNSERWIIKLSKEKYDSFTATKQSNFLVKKISDQLHLLNLISESSMSLEEVQELTTSLQPINIYRDQQLSKRDLRPDDFSFSSQWNMEILEMPAVWEQTTGGTTGNGDDIVVAILDDGFQIDHVDLEANWFVNQAEIPDDGIDNDGNGTIDDYIGYNVDTGTGRHNLLPHGTKVVGVVGAEGNNGEGVAGVNWNIKILPISGVDFIGEIEEAMSYIIMMKRAYLESNGQRGANIVVSNLSAGIDRQFPEHAPDWCEFYNLAGEVGILNIGAAPNAIINVDTEGDLPSLCTSDYLIAVTSTNESDLKVRESGFGPINIDIGAPGENVFTTTVADDYSTINGTSGAAPHVAGVAALLFSIDCPKFKDMLRDDPSGTALFVKDAIMEGVDVNEFLEQTVSRGRLNANNSFQNIVGWCTGTPLTNLDIRNVIVNPDRVMVEYNTDEFDLHEISIHDFSGRIVYQSTFQPFIFQAKEVELEFPDAIPSGLYVLKLSNENFAVTETIAIFN